MSTLGKGKIPASTNSVEAYNKEILSDEIHKLITTNIQLITDKIKTEKAKVNLETDKTQLFDKKNFLIAKKEKLRTEIVILNIANILIRNY